jgi:hypothetical protein
MNNHVDEEESPVGKKRKLNHIIKEEHNNEEERVIVTTGTKVLALPSGTLISKKILFGSSANIISMLLLKDL